MKTLILGAAACLANKVFASSEDGTSSLVFGDCPTALVPPGSRMKCGSIKVPMDWSNSSSEQITIGVAKLPARDPANRIGPLFFNPGGPGLWVSTSLSQIVSGATPVKNEILDRFDIIGVDIRGTALSTQLVCNRTLAAAKPALWPTTPEIYDASSKHNKAVRQSCIDMTGSRLVDFVDTKSQAHDHEAVRRALGDEKLTWLGQSGGTLLGTQYAELYADKIRGMVLDGVVSNSQASTSMFIVDAAGSEAAMNYFFNWCTESNCKACRSMVQNSTVTVPQLWNDLMLKAARSPIPAPECTSGKVDCGALTATPSILRQAAVELLLGFESGGNTALAEYMAAAVLKNDASGFLAFLFSSFSVPQGASAYNASYFFALNAIVCQDFAHNVSSTEIAWWQQLSKADMPHTQGNTPTLWFLYACIGWPTTGLNGPHRISIPDTLSPKILLVSNLYDPSTPPGWDTQVTEEIGWDRAVIIGRNQAGHTAYLEPPAYDGPTVAAINKYLLTLETPEHLTIYES